MRCVSLCMNNRFNPMIYLLVLLVCSTLVSVQSFHARSSQLGPSKEDCKCENLKEPEYRIVNGTRSRALEEGLPWIGFLYWKENENGILVNKIICTLTIVGRYWALTAYHCVEFFKDLYIGAGLDHNSTKILKEPKNLRKVKEIYVPKSDTDYDTEEYFENDIALLEVSEPWEFSEVTRIRPACLMNFKRDRFEDTFLAAGYGTNETWYWERGSFYNNNGSDSGVGELTMTSLKLSKLTRYYFVVKSSFSSMCTGDSGKIRRIGLWAIIRDQINFSKVATSNLLPDLFLFENLIEPNLIELYFPFAKGGPLHYYVPPILYVVGVASTGDDLVDPNGKTFTCVPGRTNTFVSVYKHLNWIRNITQGDLCEIDGATRDQTEENTPGSTTPGSTTANSNHTTSGSSRPLLLLAGCSLAFNVWLFCTFFPFQLSKD